jgi:hypothetical protein
LHVSPSSTGADVARAALGGMPDGSSVRFMSKYLRYSSVRTSYYRDNHDQEHQQPYDTQKKQLKSKKSHEESRWALVSLVLIARDLD